MIPGESQNSISYTPSRNFETHCKHFLDSLNECARKWPSVPAPGVTNFPDTDAVKISCAGGHSKIVPLVPLKQPLTWDDIPTPLEKVSEKPHPINVLLIGIDAVSRLNFLRHFNATQTLLDKVWIS